MNTTTHNELAVRLIGRMACYNEGRLIGDWSGFGRGTVMRHYLCCGSGDPCATKSGRLAPLIPCF